MKRIVSCSLALSLCLFLSLSACMPHIAYGPSDDIADAGYVQAVQAVVDSEETIKFVDKVHLLSNTARPRIDSFPAFGTLVVTDKTLYFLHWNHRKAEGFEVLIKQPIADMVDIKQITTIIGRGDYISIEDKNGRFNLFSCVAMYSTTLMIERNRELLNCLNAVRNAK